jgi:hypothetical protein
MFGSGLWLSLLLAVAGATNLSADVAVLIEEPYGVFGAFNPTGHSAIYLSNVCAETPLKLRRCEPGEHGVVISRYQTLGGYDWIAIPVIPFFYAVDRIEDVPASPDLATVQALRHAWRRANLQEVAPDNPGRERPRGDWDEMVGVAYDRSTYAFQLETSAADDDRVIEEINSAPNRKRFRILFRNCADFARITINRYYRRAIKRSVFADGGIMTPKQVAKRLVRYGRKNPDLQLSSFLVPQTPGSIPRSSKAVRGLFETFIRSKKYAAPLIVFQPWVAGTLAVGYLTRGRFNVSREAERLNLRQPEWLELTAAGEKGTARHAPAGS